MLVRWTLVAYMPNWSVNTACHCHPEYDDHDSELDVQENLTEAELIMCYAKHVQNPRIEVRVFPTVVRDPFSTDDGLDETEIEQLRHWDLLSEDLLHQCRAATTAMGLRLKQEADDARLEMERRQKEQREALAAKLAAEKEETERRLYAELRAKFSKGG